MNKRDREKWLKRVGALIEELGGTPHGTGYDLSYQIDTRAGRLDLRIDSHLERDSGPGTVFSRFDDHKRAQALGIDCNQYSGKWNHHYFRGWGMDDSLKDLRFHLEGIMPPKGSMPYDLTIDGALLCQQREAVERVALSFDLDEETQALFSGVVDLLDEVSDQARKLHGIDCPYCPNLQDK